MPDKTLESETEAALDARLDRMKRLPRGSFKARPGDTALRNCKARVTMYADADVLEYFKQRAAQPNAAPYQTQMNNELRAAMEREPTAPPYTDLLANEAFIAALSARLRAHETEQRYAGT